MAVTCLIASITGRLINLYQRQCWPSELFLGKLQLLQPAYAAYCSPVNVHSLTLQVSVSDVARPNTEKRVRGEGMPISKTPGQKGDLRIRFDVQFPHTLTDSQKAGLRKLLPSS